MPAKTKRRTFIVAAVVAMSLGMLPAPAPAQIAGPDLEVTKADSPDPVAVGADLTYTITVRNVGTVAAPGVIVTDALLLASLDFVSATPSQGSCSEVVSGAQLLVTCELGEVAAGATATVTMVTRPQVAGSLLNVVTAAPTPAALDLNPLNNVAVESTTVTGGGGGPGADLVISKADAPDPVAPSAILNYTVTVQNLGSEAATGVMVTDVLPVTGVAFESVSSSQGSCDAPAANLIIVCSVGSLALGDSATVQIVVRPSAEGTLLNTATAMATSLDPVPANNVAAASTTVSASATTPAGGGGGGGGGGQGLAACTIMGTPLDDKLMGTPGNDVICGLGGNDRLMGLGGKDTLIGGGGNDRLIGAKGADRLQGQAGKDRLRGGPGKDRLNGGPGKDRLNGGPGKDRINGGPGKDRCQRGRGDRVSKCP